MTNPKNNKWKDYFLKSGVPLEYEIKNLLDKYGCLTAFENSYLRKDKSNILTEFSYDINSTLVEESNFFELMIECKYRDPSTDWIFLPGQKINRKSLSFNSILHPNDHFTIENKFNFKTYEMPFLAQNGSKGIEITNDGQNPKSITQAINQLSYGLSRNYLDAMISQLESNDGLEDMIYFHIPIIVTTANLYLLNENTSIDNIKESNNLEDIATKQKHLAINCETGKDLENYNKEIFNNLLKRFDKNYLKNRLESDFDDVETLISVLSKHSCPSSIYVIHHDSKSNSFEELFNLIREIIYPTQKTIRFMKDKSTKDYAKRMLISRMAEDKDLPF